MWNLKYNKNKPIYEAETGTENRLVVAKEKKRWERDGLGVWG